MTSQPPEPAPTDATQADQPLKPVRDLIALALVVANALLLLAGVIELAVPAFDDDTFARRASAGFFDFLGLLPVLLPLVAVLLVAQIEPVSSKGKLITVIALAQYAFGALLGVVTLLTWLVNSLLNGAFFQLVTGLLLRVAYLAVFAAAVLTVFKLFAARFHVPKPKPQPGVYGQPYGASYPAGYPQGQQPSYQAGYAQAYGQPVGYGQQPAQGAQPGYPSYGQPTAYQSPSATGSGASYGAQPPVPAQPSGEPTQVVAAPLPSPQSGPPAVTPPAPGYPSSAPPAESQPPRWPDANERTQLMSQLGQQPASAEGDDNQRP